MKKLIYPLIFLLAACGGSDDGGGTPPEPEAPTAANLVAPANNEICLDGTPVDATQSEVIFSWDAAQHTDSYELKITNLNTQTSTSTTSSTPSTTIPLSRGEPYSWTVVSKSNVSDKTAESDRWQFYLAADGTTHYAPFPAQAKSPTIGSSIAVGEGSIALEWEATDTDGDIVEHEVKFDTKTPPETVLGTTESTTIEASIAAGNTYYWQVTTTDEQGNSAQSQVFEFKVE